MDKKVLDEFKARAYNAVVQTGESTWVGWDYERREEVSETTPVYSPDLTTMVSAASVLADYNQSNHDPEVRGVLEEMSTRHNLLKIRKIAARGVGLSGINLWARVLPRCVL